jgi:hypothetical protein
MFRVRFWTIFAIAFILYFVSSGFAHPTAYNNYSLLADAWLHGHAWISPPQSAIDAVTYAGKYYIVEAPMPAVLLLPFALIWGADANQSLLCIICAAAAVAAADLLLARMGIEDPLRVSLVIFAGTGTALWWCAAFGAVWMIAHVTTVMFLTFALAEWYGQRRFSIVGLLFACAALSRFPAILGVLPFLYWMWISEKDRRISNIGSFLAGFLPLFVLQVGYNLVRWNSPLDIGFTIFYHEDVNMGSPVGSPFGLDHIPFNVYSWIFLSPQFYVEFPWIRPTGFGVALTFTSPALVLAFAAERTFESIILWTSAILVAIPALLYFTNGFEQFGMRHTLDFTPFLFCLMARGAARTPRGLVYILIGLSSLANAYGVWYSWAYHAFSVVPRI